MIPIAEMKALATDAKLLAIALARPADKAVLVVPVEDVQAGLGTLAVREAWDKGFRFVSVLAIRADGALDSVKFPGTFPADVLAAAEFRFTELVIERGVATPTAQA